MEPREVAPAVRERQLFEQLAKLRSEQMKLRERAGLSPDPKSSERLRQIEAESTAAWGGIRAARAESRAEHRARFARPALDPFRALVQRKPG